ncbi:HlyC/CorC family transporter [Candidatus Peribacteria bacterium]|jgi:putative hemolysin|nr:HlyC/CorC family transporter [Candidatus Peribacteria bacterium]MBT4021403.1 HlyC/CorC family transporter [Candidatus Peribacteria bacterium]MBT4240419.1 HlyC/CorC family transporter [Candidatus Peribacteria bacterium]MBT4474501.1 HlyC/CorC family transporter [Candidatus Peribacteria bacterium]
MTAVIILIIVVIILSGISSGAEAAIISINPAEVESMTQDKKYGSKAVAIVTRNLSRSVTTILILNNIVNIVGSIMVGRMVMDLYGDAMLSIITTALTFGIIIFAEIIPKSLATKYAWTASLIFSPWILTITAILYPIIWPIEKMLLLLGKGERKVGTEDQIRSMVRLGRKEGYIEQDEGQLIHRAFNLNDAKAKNLMTKREDIVAFKASETSGESSTKMIDNTHSRFPIYGESLDDIRGIVLETEVLAACTKNEYSEKLSDFARPALFVDDDTAADDLLILFRNERSHMAIVQEKGKFTVGIVTLEDVLEELVGEIEDERDPKA